MPVTDLPAITGLGLITPLGATVDSTFAHLVAGDRDISEHTRLTVITTADESRASALAEQVGRQAIEQAGWTSTERTSDRTAVVIGTSKGQIAEWISPAIAFTSDKNQFSEGRSSWGLAETATHVARSLGMTAGPRLTLSAACATGLHALIRATMLIHSGEIDRVLVVAVEASVHPLFVQSFQRLGVLAPPGYGCRPFDESRAGFVMSESAAAVCLERTSTHRSPIAHIERFAMAGDAAHLTGNEPTGAALRHVLRHVIDNRSVQFVHAHGTGTVVNDPIELAAIDACVIATADRRPVVYSHKASLGHTLGTAGLLATVISCRVHTTGTVPGNRRSTTPIAAERVHLASEPTLASVQRSIALAAGFGGAIAALSLVSPVSPEL